VAIRNGSPRAYSLALRARIDELHPPVTLGAAGALGPGETLRSEAAMNDAPRPRRIFRRAEPRPAESRPAAGTPRLFGSPRLIGGVFATVFVVAVYVHLREAFGAERDQWWDAAFGIALIGAIYVQVLLARPSRLALALVTLTLGVVIGWIWLSVAVPLTPTRPTGRLAGKAVMGLVIALLAAAAAVWRRPAAAGADVPRDRSDD
jgi:hypothetical protein